MSRLGGVYARGRLRSVAARAAESAQRRAARSPTAARAVDGGVAAGALGGRWSLNLGVQARGERKAGQRSWSAEPTGGEVFVGALSPDAGDVVGIGVALFEDAAGEREAAGGGTTGAPIGVALSFGTDLTVADRCAIQLTARTTGVGTPASARVGAPPPPALAPPPPPMVALVLLALVLVLVLLVLVLPPPVVLDVEVAPDAASSVVSPLVAHP